MRGSLNFIGVNKILLKEIVRRIKKEFRIGFRKC